MAIPANIGVRKARAALADIRAMEEEEERTNPVGHTGATPSMGLSKVRGGAAVPSTGVSQFHGGKKHTLMDHIKHPMKGFGKHEEEESESDEETPMEAGRMLRKHIEELHGGRYVHHFMRGFGAVSGGMNTGATEGEGKMKGGAAPDARMVGGITAGPGFYEASGKKPKRAMAADDPRRKRGAAISKLMKEKGLTLGEASKHIKEHGY
jgi:hypothetical protein